MSLSNNLQHIAQQISKNISVAIFLEPDLSQEQVRPIEDRLSHSPLILEFEFVSSEEALSRFREKFPDLTDIVDDLKTNPFPPSFEATLKQDQDFADETGTFISQMREIQGVDDIQYNKDWVERMYSFSRLAQAIGLFLGGILILASFFIISNVIKLNVFARKGEIEILRLTGATNTFIRIPFLLEGVVLGFIGGILSLILLLFLIKLFPFYLGSSLGVLNEIINFRYLTLLQSLVVLLAGAITGLLGSITSLARFLKI